jgi:hypothetical protein
LGNGIGAFCATAFGHICRFICVQNGEGVFQGLKVFAKCVDFGEGHGISEWMWGGVYGALCCDGRPKKQGVQS